MKTKNKKMIPCVITRSGWLRGGGWKTSRLLTREGKRCTVGFLARVLGAPDSCILNESVIHKLWGLPRAVEDRVNEFDEENFVALYHAYKVNDDESLSESKRERDLKALGLKMGVCFIFLN